MVKNLLIGLVVVVLLFAIVVQTQSDTFHIERSATVAAPAEVVFAAVNDFNAWQDWSPWEKLDPNMKRTFAGEPGVGQKYHWAGNEKAGEGEMRITESVPSSRIGIALDFIKPFPGSNTVTFTFTPEDAGTKVTWAMDGRKNYLAKAMCMFQSMDAMIGPDFERGLAGLGKVAVASAGTPADGGAAAGGAGAKGAGH